jgi:hypothetical protein
MKVQYVIAGGQLIKQDIESVIYGRGINPGWHRSTTRCIKYIIFWERGSEDL